jgi:hypothetical protein
MTASADTTQQITCSLLGWRVSPPALSVFVGDSAKITAIPPPNCGGATYSQADARFSSHVA